MQQSRAIFIYSTVHSNEKMSMRCICRDDNLYPFVFLCLSSCVWFSNFHTTYDAVLLTWNPLFGFFCRLDMHSYVVQYVSTILPYYYHSMAISILISYLYCWPHISLCIFIQTLFSFDLNCRFVCCSCVDVAVSVHSHGMNAISVDGASACSGFLTFWDFLI